MDANDLYKKMEALRPDSMDELDLMDEDNGLSIRIWKENIEDNVGAYYRIRISGFGGLVCELLPDEISVYAGVFQMYTGSNGDEALQLCGRLDVSKWVVKE